MPITSINFGIEELAELDAQAKEEGRSRSQQINYLIRKSREPQRTVEAENLRQTFPRGKKTARAGATK